MTDEVKTYTATCGKCGTLEVEAEAESCPQCNNPLLDTPAVAAPVPPTPTQSGAAPTPPAGTEPKPAPLEIVTEPRHNPAGPSEDETVDKMMQGMIAAVPEDQRAQIIEKTIACSLRMAGFPADEAAKTARAAMVELDERAKDRAEANEPELPAGDQAASAR